MDSDGENPAKKKNKTDARKAEDQLDDLSGLKLDSENVILHPVYILE